MHIDGILENRDKIPKASSLEKIIKETDDTNPDIRMLIEVKVSREKKKELISL